MTEPKDRLRDLLNLSAERMQLDAKGVRLAFDHNAEVGHANEATLARFLRQRLPTSIGVASGFVIDTTGGQSRQIDVILYDAQRTPLLFEGADGVHLVPAEGVLAVIEVKTTLDAKGVRGALANCRSVKQLQRTAYFRQPVEPTYTVYGREWIELPLLYSIFAGTADNAYGGLLNDLQKEVPPEERIDMVCTLDRGVTINVKLEFDPTPMNRMEARTIDGGHMADAPTKSPLLVWYTMIAGAAMKSGVRPIDVGQYVRGELSLTADLPANAAESMKDQIIEHMVATTGVDPATLRRLADDPQVFADAEKLRNEIASRENYEMCREMPVFESPGATQHERFMDFQARTARTIEFEEWATLDWLAAFDSGS